MVSMSSTIEMETSTRGGMLSGLRRSVLGGESFFINTFRAEEAGEVTLAPALPGDIVALELTGGTTLLVQSGSFLAATEGVDVDTKWGGGKSFFSSEGLFLLRCTGQGTIWVSSYGAIHPIDLAVGEPYVVDTGHMVAFDDSVQYDVGPFGRLEVDAVQRRGPGREADGAGALLHADALGGQLPELAPSEDPEAGRQLGRSRPVSRA